jgi:hypothetical protein
MSGGNIMICKVTRYYSDNGFEFTFEPIEETLAVKKTPDGFEARYLVQDLDDDCNFLFDDDGLFLIHYHRDFRVEHKKVIIEDDLRAWYQGEKIEQAKAYWIFSVKALIHSGVWLELGGGPMSYDPYMGFDTSHVGAVLASKEEFRTKAKAKKAAEGLLETWNQINSGEVYILVKETYDQDKKPVDYDTMGGVIGNKYALEELKTF